jgi:hypothetical protein
VRIHESVRCQAIRAHSQPEETEAFNYVDNKPSASWMYIMLRLSRIDISFDFIKILASSVILSHELSVQTVSVRPQGEVGS